MIGTLRKTPDLDNEIKWVSPVSNNSTFVISRGTVELKATPSNSVNMATFDHLSYTRYDDSIPGSFDDRFVEIGAASTAPYSVILNVDTLDVGYTQVFVFVVDKEGHRSPYNPQNRINIYKANAIIYIPIVTK